MVHGKQSRGAGHGKKGERTDTDPKATHTSVTHTDTPRSELLPSPR